jgi:hypothetical protein
VALVHPALAMDPPALAFVHSHRAEFDAPRFDTTALAQRAVVTLSNPTAVPLEFTASCATPALALDGYEFALAPGEARALGVTLEPLYRDDHESHVLSARVVLAFRGHPRRAALPVTAELRFANLTLNADALDFGVALNDTLATREVTLTNRSALRADFAWSLEEDAEAARARAHAAGLPHLPANRVFDVAPAHGSLAPGEALPVSVTFYAHAHRAFAAAAVCDVAGGRSYRVALAGRASHAHARVDAEALDLGRVPHDGTAVRTLALANPGRVELAFTAAIVAAAAAAAPVVVEEGDEEGDGAAAAFSVP